MVSLDIISKNNCKFVLSSEYNEQAIYSVTEGIKVDGEAIEEHRLLVLESANEVEITSTMPGRCMIIGGEPLGESYNWCNFVSTRRDHIEQAKYDWQQGKFPQVPE